MNKIKTLYDVFKTMKEKEIIKGKIKLEAAKKQVKVLEFSNDFETNIKNGETKAKLDLNFDNEGQKVKHESNSEFNIKECPVHKFHKDMHMKHHRMHGKCGIKAGLSKITFLLNLLNNVQIEEKDDKAIISLELKEVLKEVKDMHKDFHNEGENHKRFEHHKHMHNDGDKEVCNHHKFIKELLCSEESNPLLKIYTNKNKEIEKIEISAKGENAINGVVDLVW